MGGWGSGRWQRGKDQTSDYIALDVRHLQRKGLLGSNHEFAWNWYRNDQKVASIHIQSAADRLTLKYQERGRDGIWHLQEYPVSLDWTPCTYGGQRAWFRCPAVGCGRRVAILYGGSIFACRHCHQLSYPCQRERAGDRVVRRANGIRERLGWPPGILNGMGQKPNGMHWRTYWRLLARHDLLMRSSMVGLAREIDKLKARMKD